MSDLSKCLTTCTVFFSVFVTLRFVLRENSTLDVFTPIEELEIKCQIHEELEATVRNVRLRLSSHASLLFFLCL